MEDIVFRGNYSSWEEARSLTTGYDSQSILSKVLESALKVKSGEAVFERDAVPFFRREYQIPLLACLLRVASADGNRLRILDFGGSLGSTYFQCLPFLSDLEELKWNIVEQKHFVECGQKQLQSHNLKFFYTINECLSAENPFAVLLSGVIQYNEKPYTLLETVLEHNFEFIVIDRTPLLNEGFPDRLTIEVVPPEIYPASYPSWFLNREKFLGHFAAYEMLLEFDSFERWDLGDTIVQNKGFLFRRLK